MVTQGIRPCAILCGWGRPGSVHVLVGLQYTYNRQTAEAFGTELTAIAWCGKGMYYNCCEQSYSRRWALETIPSIWHRRLHGG